MKTFKYSTILIAVLITMGCVQTRYSWNNYDQKLYNHYKNPAAYDQYVLDLSEIITSSEETGKVPPGIYAEYAFMLYEKGNFPEAINYFKKEQDKWPESNVIMTKMINNAKKRSSQTEEQKDSSKNDIIQVQEVAK